MEKIQPTGLLTSGPIVTGSQADTFGTHFDYLGIGGWRAVDSLATLYAIPVTERLESSNSSGQRRRWMRVFVWQDDEQAEYQLVITDAQWAAAGSDAAKIALLAANKNWQLIPAGLGGGKEPGAKLYDLDGAGAHYILNSVAPLDKSLYYVLFITEPETGEPGMGARFSQDTIPFALT
jgi:hypothetical protein